MIESCSFHIVKPCNMKCKFCYATFEDMHVKQMSREDAFICIDKLIDSGVQKITFAGGEPMLYKHIDAVIMYSKKQGATTSIISNGSMITNEWLIKMMPWLDWIGISIDTLDAETQNKIGRKSIKSIDYLGLINSINLYKFKLKINTVVNSYNKNEDFNKFISWANPERWKVFQALRVDGQNDAQFGEIKVSDYEFNAYINRHSKQKSLVPESNEYMTASYLLIDPQGRLFENSKGWHTYSDSLIDNDMPHCMSQVNIDKEMFIKRGGIYKW